MMCLWTFLIVVIGVLTEINGDKKCPSQETILPCRCLIKGEEFQIWCSHSDLTNVLEGLKAIGQSLPEPIDELILENNHLPSLPGRAFIPLKVVRLMLRHNRLERVSSDWLIGLENSLMELFVVEPDLRSLPEDSLIQLNNLEAITIETKLIKRLPLFSGLPKLRYVQIETLSLVELSSRILKDLPRLETLHISKSPRLTRLEGNFLRDLPTLTRVNISYCGINWLHPRAITRLPNLKELSLIGNKIDDVAMVGRATRDLPQLQILRLDHNLIDKISEASFVDLPSLRQLFLSNNHITELQYGAFHRVPQLTRLDLNRNNVRRIHPESFLQPSGSGLEELWLVENDIGHVEQLRSLLDALPRLIFLDMSWNHLETIPFGAIRGHPTLERLHLDYNEIHLIDTEGFMAMPALRELRLRNNSLTDPLDGPFWNLPALKGLDLSGNFFTRLQRTLFANLPSLRRVDVSLNHVTVIDSDTFAATPALEHVNLSHNHLTNLHPATFRHLLSLYELDVGFNELLTFVPNLPRGIEYLRMGNNRITEIPPHPSLDVDLPSLRMLDLSDNGISELTPNSLQSAPQLRRLYLRNNALQQLDEGSLGGLTRLEVLHLEDNAINRLHPKSLVEMTELRDFNLKRNKIDVLFPEMFRNMPNLRYLDISRNKIAEIMPKTFEINGNLRKIDASHNLLVRFPRNLNEMKNLTVLDLSHNRLKDFDSLSTFTSLNELKLSDNFIQELKRGALDSFRHLTLLHLDDNQLESVESYAIRSLPALQTLKLNRNKIRNIPNFAFSDLPTLEKCELQENVISTLESDAFHVIPHLLMLNLSRNHLKSLHDAGLKGLKSLELLDVSGNRINRVTGRDLSKMEWLVELRMDDNDICAVHGKPFDGMPRLRVLTMKNNKMVSLPEQSMEKLRSNLAVLEMDGNPLSCTCGLLWLQGWLQEGSSMGPKCLDGTLVREMRLSRQNCSPDERHIELTAPGCESELLSAPGTSHVFTHRQWMNVKSENYSHVPPSPEESEYFYDEYVDYPYNDTNRNVEMTKIQTKSPHFTAGDTPTLYAAANKVEIPKDVPNSPSTSGFTFFGVPLTNIFGGRTAGRTNDAKSEVKTIAAERKSAIMNKPPRGSSRGSILPNLYDLKPPPLETHHELEVRKVPQLMMGPPNSPHIQTGGFIPLLPGSVGGFKPILDKNVSVTVTEVEVIPSIATVIDATEAPNDLFIEKGIPTSLPAVTSAITPSNQNVTVLLQFEDEVVANATDEVITAKADERSTFPEIETLPSMIEEDVGSTTVATTTQQLVQTSSELVTTSMIPTTTGVLPEEASTIRAVGTPLSALLIPGGQQPEYRPSGRPSITKIQSPHSSSMNSEIEQVLDPLPHNREPKQSENKPMISVPKDETNWYFANYNKTNLDPYIGTDPPEVSSSSASAIFYGFLMISFGILVMM